MSANGQELDESGSGAGELQTRNYSPSTRRQRVSIFRIATSEDSPRLAPSRRNGLAGIGRSTPPRLTGGQQKGIRMSDVKSYRLEDAVETWLSSLPEPDFRALVARTRPPDEPIPSRLNSLEALR